MSVYTTEVRYICETAAGLEESQGFNSVHEILNKAWANVFNFDFPIYDENHREELCKKILLAYYTREIGLETVGLWKLKLCTKLNLIMPYYNKLYESETFKYDPIHDTDITTTHQETGSDNRTIDETVERTDNSRTELDSNASTNTNNTNKNVNKYSDTPQGTVQDVEDDYYLTNATVDTNNAEATVTNHSDSEQTYSSNQNDTKNTKDDLSKTVDYTTTVKGKSGSNSYSSLIQEYRQAILNIDNMVIAELSDLFMNIWRY